MRLTCLLAVSLVCALYISQVSGTCICGALSEDYCTCRGLRPNPKILIGSHSFLAPQSSGGCQCGNHIVDPVITHPHTYVKSIPLGVFYTTPLCSSCSAFGRPVCSDCITNCKPLCSKCALHGKPVCSACVASIGLPTVKVYSLSDEEAEASNPVPQKALPSADMSEQASNPSASYSFVSNGKDYIEVTETKSNLTTGQLTGLRKFFGLNSNNNNNNNKPNNAQSRSSSSTSSSSSSTSGMENSFKRNEIEKNEELVENKSNSEESKTQAIYFTYTTGLGYVPDKLTKIITIPSSNDHNQQQQQQQHSRSTSTSSLMEFFRF